MHCENCGHKLNDGDLFCEDCGTKINRVNPEKNNNLNKALWIILGSVFGGIFLLIVLFIISFGILVADYNSNIDKIIDYDIEEEYDYKNDGDIIHSVDSF